MRDIKDIFAITHTFREGGRYDPSSTTAGLLQVHNSFRGLVGFIALDEVPLVLVAESRRCLEIFKILQQDSNLSHIKPLPCPILGTPTSRRKGRKGQSLVMVPGFGIFKEEEYYGFARARVDWWDAFLKDLPNRTLLFTGAYFLVDMLGLSEGHSCSFYKLNVLDRTATCFIRHGQWLKRPETVLSSIPAK